MIDLTSVVMGFLGATSFSLWFCCVLFLFVVWLWRRVFWLQYHLVFVDCEVGYVGVSWLCKLQETLNKNEE